MSAIKKILSKYKSINKISVKAIKQCRDDIPNILDDTIIEYLEFPQYLDYIKNYIDSFKLKNYNDGTISIQYIIENININNLEKNFTNEKINIKIYNIDINRSYYIRGTSSYIDRFIFFEFIQKDKVIMIIEFKIIHNKVDNYNSCTNTYYIHPKIHILK